MCLSLGEGNNTFHHVFGNFAQNTTIMASIANVDVPDEGAGDRFFATTQNFIQEGFAAIDDLVSPSSNQIDPSRSQSPVNQSNSRGRDNAPVASGSKRPRDASASPIARPRRAVTLAKAPAPPSHPPKRVARKKNNARITTSRIAPLTPDQQMLEFTISAHTIFVRSVIIIQCQD